MSRAPVPIFFRTAERLSNKLLATLQQVGSKLATGPREIVERVKIKVTSQRYHNTAGVSIAIRQLRLLRIEKEG